MGNIGVMRKFFQKCGSKGGTLGGQFFCDIAMNSRKKFYHRMFSGEEPWRIRVDYE